MKRFTSTSRLDRLLLQTPYFTKEVIDCLKLGLNQDEILHFLKMTGDEETWAELKSIALHAIRVLGQIDTEEVIGSLINQLHL